MPFSLLRPRTWFAKSDASSSEAGAVSRSTRMVPTWDQGRAIKPKYDIKRYADEGYRRNAVVNACIAELLSTVSEPELVVLERKDDGTEVPTTSDASNRLRALLRKPNPEYSQREFIERLMLHSMISGQWFVHKARDKNGALGELWPIRPDRIAPMAPTNAAGPTAGLITEYQFTGPDQSKTPIPANDIINCTLQPDYLDEFGAMPPMSPVATWIDLDNDAGTFLRTFFKNNAEPAGYLKFQRTTDPKDRERARQLWQERHGGVGNAGRTGVIDDGVDYVKSGAAPNQLRLDNIFDETECRICGAFGISPLIIGQRIGLLQSTYSNLKEAREALWQEKLIPWYTRCADKLTTFLAGPEFDDTLVVRFDTSKVVALLADSDAEAAQTVSVWEMRLVTRDEARVRLGIEPVKDGTGGEYYSTARTSEPADATTTPDPTAAEAVVPAVHRHGPIERHALAKQRKAIQALMKGQFAKQGKALAAYLEDEIAALRDESESKK